MARVKGAMMTRKRRKSTLKAAKGYWGAKSKHFKMASFFWSLFAWKIFFQPFTFSLYVSPVLRWVSCRQHM